MDDQVIKIAEQFTRYPAGRYRTDGPYSGQRFREDLLMPAMRSGKHVTIDFDGTMGFGSSFLEEVFGGLIRNGDFSPEQVLKLVSFRSQDPSLIDEIREYITSTRH